MIAPRIDLNCDMGEGDPSTDVALLELVTSANIACGGHAGDEGSMRATVRACVERGVAVGAHPGYPDRPGFGRTPMQIETAALEASIAEQIGALSRVARELGARLAHVKPHGALYHAAMANQETAAALARASRAVDPELILVGQAGARGLEWWRGMDCRIAAEAFVDRVYEPSGLLRSRTLSGALITDPALAAEQAERLALGRPVNTAGGPLTVARPDTLCVHSDTADAPAIAHVVRARLTSAGFALAALRRA